MESQSVFRNHSSRRQHRRITYAGRRSRSTTVFWQNTVRKQKRQMCLFWIAGARNVEKLRFSYVMTAMNLSDFSTPTSIINLFSGISSSK